MKPSQIQQVLAQLLPLRENVLLVGSPGCAKTDSVVQAAKALDYDLIITHPVVDDPTDYQGMPAVTSRGTGKDKQAAAEFLPFGDLWKMIEAKKPTIVFPDDMGQATPAVQAALMQLVLARSINGHKISEHVRFVAATNRREDKAAVTGLITPLLDRFATVLTVDFDLDDWVRWGLVNNMPPELLAFARFKPQLMNKFEANRDMKKSPTPRSVAGLGRLINAKITNFEVLEGAVGTGFATEFVAFFNTYRDLPNLDTIYLAPDTAPLPAKERADIHYALMGALSHRMNEVNIDATVRYLGRLTQPEFSVLCMKDALVKTESLKTTRAFTHWALDHAEVFGYSN